MLNTGALYNFNLNNFNYACNVFKQKVPPIVVKYVDKKCERRGIVLSLFDDALFADEMLFNKYFPKVRIPSCSNYRLFDAYVKSKRINRQRIAEEYAKRSEITNPRLLLFQPIYVPKYYVPKSCIEGFFLFVNPCYTIYSLLVLNHDYDKVDKLKESYIPRVLEGCLEVCRKPEVYDYAHIVLPYYSPSDGIVLTQARFVVMVLEVLMLIDCDVLRERVNETGLTEMVNYLVKHKIERFEGAFRENNRSTRHMCKVELGELFDAPYTYFKQFRESIQFLREVFERRLTVFRKRET